MGLDISQVKAAFTNLISRGETERAGSSGALNGASVRMADTANRPAHSSSLSDRIRTAFNDFKKSVSDFIGRFTASRENNAPAAAATGGATASATPPASQPLTSNVAFDNISVTASKNILTDTPATRGYTGDNFRFERVETDLNALFSSIEAKAQTGDKSVDTLTEEAARKLVLNLEAKSFMETDTDGIRGLATEFRSAGQADKADFLEGMADLVDLGRTPDGAEELFRARADLHMTEAAPSSGEVFLRSTSHEGAIAVRKLMQANGIFNYATAVKTAVDQLLQRPENQDLEAALANQKVKNGSDIQTPELAADVARFAKDVLQTALNVPVPDGAKAVLGSLVAEIQTRDDDKIAGHSQKLFSDQLVLKGMSAELSASGTTLTKIAADFINKSASGTANPNGYGDDMTKEYQAFKGVAGPQLEALFQSSGKPASV